MAAGIVAAPEAVAFDDDEEHSPMNPIRLRARLASWCRRALTGAAALALLALSVPAFAGAAVGVTRIAADGDRGPVTVFYPSDAAAATVKRGPFTYSLAEDGAPIRGNGRLVAVSHGSGGSAWVHADLAQALVGAGFVVAFPEHRGDSTRDPGTPGPESWTIRPREVSAAIDAVAGDARFAPLLALDRVGLYGMSAGGHTALSLAGGRWSPALFARHCDANLAADFSSCVGLITRLTGSVFDPLRLAIARLVIGWKFGADARLRDDVDPRIAAVVAGVPAAADFDLASLAAPRVPLALVTARHDRWLVPRFHADAVLAACPTCEHLADFPTGGHGALLSPSPPGLGGLEGKLLNDPPGFDRVREAPAVDAAIVGYFRRHLLGAGGRRRHRRLLPPSPARRRRLTPPTTATDPRMSRWRSGSARANNAVFTRRTIRSCKDARHSVPCPPRRCSPPPPSAPRTPPTPGRSRSASSCP